MTVLLEEGNHTCEYSAAGPTAQVVAKNKSPILFFRIVLFANKIRVRPNKPPKIWGMQDTVDQCFPSFFLPQSLPLIIPSIYP
jgi:hypothetical protein